MATAQNLEVSATELRFSLDPSPSKHIQYAAETCVITLRHVGNIQDHVAFKVKTTHVQRYIVRPNKGVLAPNSSLNITVLFVEMERKRLWHMREQLGQFAIDLGVDALLIQSCVVSPFMADRLKVSIKQSHIKGHSINVMPDGFWRDVRNMEHTKIRVHHYCTLEQSSASTFSSTSNFSGPAIVPPPFPTTNAVISCANEIEENNRRGRCAKGIICICTFVGIIVAAYGSLIIGYVALHLGLNSLIKIVLDGGGFVRRLQKFCHDSVVVEGRVLRRDKKVDEVLEHEHYLVQLQYDALAVNGDRDEENGESRFREITYSSSVVMHEAKELYELTEHSPTVALKALPDYPASAIPAFLLEQKLDVSLQWYKRFHRIRAILGILAYLSSGFLWLLLFPYYVVLPWSISGIILLLPFSINRARQELELKKKLLTKEPASIPTENDACRWILSKLGPSPSRRVKLIMSIIGAFVGLVMSPPGFILLAVFGFVPLVGWSSSARRLKLLKSFKEEAIPTRGKIHSHRSETMYDSTAYYASIKYAMKMGGDAYIFEREIQNENMYNNVGKAVMVYVHPRYPLSGYPQETITKMIQTETCYSTLRYPIMISLAICTYFFFHWLIYYEGADVSDPLATMVFMWIITIIAPILVVPQLLIWGEVNYQKVKEELFSGAKVTSFRHLPRQQFRGNQNHPVEKAVQVCAEDEHDIAEIVKAVPASLEDESNTVSTVMTDDASTVTSDNINYFEWDDDNGGSDGLIHAELV